MRLINNFAQLFLFLILILGNSYSYTQAQTKLIKKTENTELIQLTFSAKQLEFLESGKAKLASCGYASCTFNDDCCDGACIFGPCRG